MTDTPPDLRRLERDAFRRYYEDGVFDIYLGLMLLVFLAAWALWDRLESALLTYVGVLALGLLVTVLLLTYRRHLLRERLGTFEPGPQRRARIGRTRWVLLGSVVLGVIAFGIAAASVAGPGSLDLVTLVVPTLWLVNAVVVFGAMAHYLDVARFYAYGVVAGLLMPLLIWPDALWGIELPAWLIFGSAGLTVTVYGVVKLRRFLRRYPVPQHG